VHPDVRARFGPFKVNSEGKIPYMYCDNYGLVTAAVGVAYREPRHALKAPWMSLATRQKASEQEVLDTYKACEAHFEKSGTAPRAKAYHPLNQVYMTDVALKAYVLQVADRKARYAQKGFGDQFLTFPADAQLAVVALLWKYGTTIRLKEKKPDLWAAIKAADFIQCAKTCNLPGDSEVREWKNKAFRFMFVTADAVVKSQSDPEGNVLDPRIVRWPAVWLYEDGVCLEYDYMPEKAPGREHNSW
jgi:hypothetical protein